MSSRLKAPVLPPVHEEEFPFVDCHWASLFRIRHFTRPWQIVNQSSTSTFSALCSVHRLAGSDHLVSELRHSFKEEEKQGRGKGGGGGGVDGKWMVVVQAAFKTPTETAVLCRRSAWLGCGPRTLPFLCRESFGCNGAHWSC